MVPLERGFALPPQGLRALAADPGGHPGLVLRHPIPHLMRLITDLIEGWHGHEERIALFTAEIVGLPPRANTVSS